MGNYPDRCGYCDEKHQECTCQPVNPGWRMTRAHALAAINERFNGTPFAAEMVMVSRSEFAAICSEHDQAALDLAAHVLELTALLEAAEARNAASERDAGRYRWLRDSPEARGDNWEVAMKCGQELDAAIDAHAQGQAGEEKDG